MKCFAPSFIESCQDKLGNLAGKGKNELAVKVAIPLLSLPDTPSGRESKIGD